MLRAISAISAYGMLIALSFCNYSVSGFFFFFFAHSSVSHGKGKGEKLKTEIHVSEVVEKGGSRKKNIGIGGGGRSLLTLFSKKMPALIEHSTRAMTPGSDP